MLPLEGTIMVNYPLKYAKVFLMAGTTFLIFSCEERDTVHKNETFDVSSVKLTTSEHASAVENLIIELKKIKPLEYDELQKLIPTSINNIKRTSYHASTSFVSMTKGEYYKSKDTGLIVSIMDGAGTTGSKLIQNVLVAQYVLEHNKNLSKIEKGSRKLVDIAGVKGIEQYNESKKEHIISYVAKNRFAVRITGINTGTDELIKAATQINFK